MHQISVKTGSSAFKGSYNCHSLDYDSKTQNTHTLVRFRSQCFWNLLSLSYFILLRIYMIDDRAKIVAGKHVAEAVKSLMASYRQTPEDWILEELLKAAR